MVDDEEQQKMPARRSKSEDSRRPPMRKGWPFTTTPESTTITDKIWRRIKNQVEKEKRIDTAADDLSSRGKATRKKAKKTSKSIRKVKDSDVDGIVQRFLQEDGINLSQASKYERGEIKNKQGKYYSSQDHVEYYRNGEKSDE